MNVGLGDGSVGVGALVGMFELGARVGMLLVGIFVGACVGLSVHSHNVGTSR